MYQIGRSRRPRARLKLTAFCTLSRSFSSSIDEAIARRQLARRGVDLDGRSTGAPGRARGSGPGANRTFGDRRARAAISAARWPSSNAQTESVVLHVHACRRARCAPATRCGRSQRPTAAGQRSTQLGHPGLRAEARELAPGSRYRAAPCSTSTSCAGSTGQRAGVRRGDHRLAHRRDARGEHAGAGRGRAPRARRRAGAAAAQVEQLRLGEEQREHGEPLLALRAELAQVAAAARDQHVVEVRARGPSTPRSRSRGEPRLERRDRRRLARRRRAARRAGRARRRARRSRAQAPSSAAPRVPRRARRPSSATRSVHGVERVARREPQLDPAERGVPLRERGDVVLRQRRRAPAQSRPSTRSKYARRAAGPPLTTASRSGVKTSVANSRRSDSADGSRAPFSRASFACAVRAASPTPRPGACAARRRSSTRPAVSPKRISCASWRVRGEKPCVADVQRLEQVRLAGAVLARPRARRRARATSSSARVRAVVAKRERG